MDALPRSRFRSGAAVGTAVVAASALPSFDFALLVRAAACELSTLTASLAALSLDNFLPFSVWLSFALPFPARSPLLFSAALSSLLDFPPSLAFAALSFAACSFAAFRALMASMSGVVVISFDSASLSLS